jgi:hypothetical protein
MWFFNKLKAISDRFLSNVVLKSIRIKSHMGLLIYEKFLRTKEWPGTGRDLQECYFLFDLRVWDSSL